MERISALKRGGGGGKLSSLLLQPSVASIGEQRMELPLPPQKEKVPKQALFLENSLQLQRMELSEAGQEMLWVESPALDLAWGITSPTCWDQKMGPFHYSLEEGDAFRIRFRASRRGNSGHVYYTRIVYTCVYNVYYAVETLEFVPEAHKR